jgi:hypothetical protein
MYIYIDGTIGKVSIKMQKIKVDEGKEVLETKRNLQISKGLGKTKYLH